VNQGDVEKTDAIGRAKESRKHGSGDPAGERFNGNSEENQACCRGWSLVWYDEVAAQMFAICGLCLLILLTHHPSAIKDEDYLWKDEDSVTSPSLLPFSLFVISLSSSCCCCCCLLDRGGEKKKNKK